MMGRLWTREEIDYLTDNYGRLNGKACAEHLNRSEHSVYRKVCYMGLTTDAAYIKRMKEWRSVKVWAA